MTDQDLGTLPRVSLATIAGQWLRIGCIGFGGPPAHIALLRQLCVERRGWLAASEFEDGVATTNLLPGPASTQLAIFCAWRLRRAIGAIVGGCCFIFPGLVLILLLAWVFLARHPPDWVLGAGAGAGASVPAVAVRAASTLAPASWVRIGPERNQKVRWLGYGVSGGASAATIGPYLVLVLVACGILEVLFRSRGEWSARSARLVLPAVVGHATVLGGLGAVAWIAFKVGALSYGGGFVIIPLMQHDAVTTYHLMTNGQFLAAVALGQVTPGPVVQTVSVVGYAADGVRGGLVAALVAFLPSFLFVVFGARHFDRIRANATIQAFLSGAGPAVIGAIAGSAVALGVALGHLWQLGLLGAAGVWLLAVRGQVTVTIVGTGVIGALAAVAGAPVGH